MQFRFEKVLLRAICLVVLCNFVFCNRCGIRRQKRYLIHYQGGLFKVILAIGIPIKLGLKQSLSVAVNLQYQYALSPNASLVLKPYPPIIRQIRETNKRNITDRELAYMGIEAALNRTGASGRECLLKSICENAENSVGEYHNGLYGKLLHIILTPSYREDEINSIDPVYLDAQKAGEFGVECSSLYPDCPEGNGLEELLYHI